MNVFLLTAGKFSGVFASEDLAKDAAKQIAVKQHVRFKARIEQYPVNTGGKDRDFIYHEKTK